MSRARRANRASAAATQPDIDIVLDDSQQAAWCGSCRVASYTFPSPARLPRCPDHTGASSLSTCRADILAGRNCFITGAAGSGKSALIAYVVQKLAGEGGRRVALTAMTGAAAEIIGGTTLHHCLGYTKPTKV